VRRSYFGYLKECFAKGYREFGGEVMSKAQASQIAYDNNYGCVYWVRSGEYQFIKRVFADPLHTPPFNGRDKTMPSYVIVRSTT